MKKLLKLLLTLLAIVVCYVGLPGVVFLIFYLCGMTKPGEMSGHWTDNAGGRHEPQADPGGIIFTFAFMLIALIVGGIFCFKIIEKIDEIKD